MWRSALWICVLLTGTLGGELRAVVTVSDKGTYVIDQAHLLSAQESQQIEGWLVELFAKTHAQVKLLTVANMEGEEIVGFSQRHYELWKLGSREKSDGALLVVAVQERKVRVHTGYGLEGALPDSWCGSTCREIARDYFKAGRFGPGLVELAARVARQVAHDQQVQLTGVPVEPPVQTNDDVPWHMLIILVLMFVLPTMAELFRITMHRRYPRSEFFRQTWLKSGSGSRFGGGGSGGGSFGGGSFGGGGSSGGGGGGASW